MHKQWVHKAYRVLSFLAGQKVWSESFAGPEQCKRTTQKCSIQTVTTNMKNPRFQISSKCSLTLISGTTACGGTLCCENTLRQRIGRYHYLRAMHCNGYRSVCEAHRNIFQSSCSCSDGETTLLYKWYCNFFTRLNLLPRAAELNFR